MTCDAHIDTGAHIDTISHDPSPSSSLPSHLYSPMCYLLLVFALGGAAEQPRCDACDKVDCPGAVGGACPHFRDARGRPLPRVQPHPSAEQLTAQSPAHRGEDHHSKHVCTPKTTSNPAQCGTTKFCNFEQRETTGGARLAGDLSAHGWSACGS